MFLGWCFCGSTYSKNKPAGDTRDETTGHVEKHVCRTLNPDTTDCRNLFNKPKLDEVFYSPNYLEHRQQLDATLKRVTDAEKEKGNKRNAIEGHSGGVSHESRLFHWLAG